MTPLLKLDQSFVISSLNEDCWLDDIERFDVV